ncbi:LAQU0S05e01882g1_1 [Lachancea quebecensis]|uniref:Nuclear fusion protein KAR5 n=1 Tax=Lachancea quebecensis TaxID=1654605 RepID=A0A0P1KRH8_9SACH|nr:LAQU0S05e01882g1_1 [Lachancea quebecensis]
MFKEDLMGSCWSMQQAMGAGLLTVIVWVFYSRLGDCDRLETVDYKLLSLEESGPLSNELERIVELNFPFYKSSCAMDALRDFLPRCIKHGIDTIDPKRRVNTAIKLSFCEFQESGLEELPEHCQKSTQDEMKKCLDEMRSSPQWWTTYSGNYQRLPTLCYENSLPFEKEQLLEVFLNVTRMYADFNKILDLKLQRRFEEYEATAEKNLFKVKRVFENYFNDFDDSYSARKATFFQDFEHHQEDTLLAFDKNIKVVQTEVAGFESDMWQDLKALKQYIHELNDDLRSSGSRDRIESIKAESLVQLQNLRDIIKTSSEDSVSFIKSKEETLNHFYSKTTNQLSKVDEAVSNTYMDALLAIQDLRGLVQDSITPLVKEDIENPLRQLSQDLAQNLEAIDDNLCEKAELWANSFDDTFERVHADLNFTAWEVRHINKDLGNFTAAFEGHLKALNISIKVFSISLDSLVKLLRIVPPAARPFLMIVILRYCPTAFSFSLGKLIGNMAQVFQICVVIIALMSGCLLGFNLT